MGVAGAGLDAPVIAWTGIAGLLAGAFSMGVGEYVSVQAQRELLDYQLAFQRHQLREAPDHERRILSDIYIDRGLGAGRGKAVCQPCLREAREATRLLIFEEVGLDERSIGSPLTACWRRLFFVHPRSRNSAGSATSSPRARRRSLPSSRREPHRPRRSGGRDQPPDSSAGLVQRRPPGSPRRSRGCGHLWRGNVARGWRLIEHYVWGPRAAAPR